MAAIERMRAVTGDPSFDEFRDLVVHYGFDHDFERTAARVQRELFGDHETLLLRQVAFLTHIGLLVQSKTLERPGRRRKLSILEACQVVAAEAGLQAPSFDAAAERLRRAYAAKRPRPDPGDIERAIALSLTVRRLV
jgi:hypothetical protein